MCRDGKPLRTTSFSGFPSLHINKILSPGINTQNIALKRDVFANREGEQLQQTKLNR
jgi:hypothetical protein